MLTPSHGARPALHPSQQQPSLAPCHRQSFPQLLHSYIKILSQEELHGLLYFSSYKTFNQILRCLVPALGLCPALLLQSRCCSCRALRMEAPSAPCPQRRGWHGRRSRIARLIVHPQSWKSRDKKPPEIWILGSVVAQALAGVASPGDATTSPRGPPLAALGSDPAPRGSGTGESAAARCATRIDCFSALHC